LGVSNLFPPDFSQDKSWIEIKNKMGIELTKEEKKILKEQ
jgi:hypothetical protein